MPVHTRRFEKPTWKPNRVILLGLAALVAAFLAFEVIVHHLPPDSVTITSVYYSAITDSTLHGPGMRAVTKTARYSGAQGQVAIQRLTSVFDAAPRNPPLYYATLPNCGGLGWTDITITYTWRGLPVQSWANQGGCPAYQESSGGLPNLLSSRTLTLADAQVVGALVP